MPMPTALLLLASGLLIALAAGVAEGRRGNELLLADQAVEAEERYVAGLAQDGVPAEIEAALWNNLGLARLAAGRAAQADSAFARALAAEPDPARRARTAYNAGTAALSANQPSRAVGYLRRALVLDPSDTAARVNLEIALLRLRRGDRDEEPPEGPEPSEFALELKARADSLVAARQYPPALALMEDGLARDSTVAAFGEFTQRLTDLVGVDTLTQPVLPDSLRSR